MLLFALKLVVGDGRVSTCFDGVLPRPQKYQNNSPKLKITAIKAIIEHTAGVQVRLL